MAQTSPAPSPRRAAAPAAARPGPISAAPWWMAPATVVAVLTGFGIYGLWSALVAGPAEIGPYLSPFYSPRLWSIGNLSPALWVLPIPLALRASCYHYRKAYHRSFFGHPLACGRSEAPGRGARPYTGETRPPFSLNNLHRFALHLSLVVLVFLWIDAVESLSQGGRWHLGLGSLLMLVNVVLLSGYTLGCHSLRHLVGGGLDCYSAVRCGPARQRAWRGVSRLTARHGIWAWASLASVVAVDAYIRALQHGLPDPHLGG